MSDLNTKIMNASNYVDEHLEALQQTQDKLKAALDTNTITVTLVAEGLQTVKQHRAGIPLLNAFKSIMEPLKTSVLYFCCDDFINTLKQSAVDYGLFMARPCVAYVMFTSALGNLWVVRKVGLKYILHIKLGHNKLA